LIDRLPDARASGSAVAAYLAALQAPGHQGDTVDNIFSRNANDVLNDYRARLALAAEERAERRRLDLDEQRSSQNTPTVRIRAWEKVHGLRLPSDGAHAILAIIAADTGLSLTDVHAEQQIRRPVPPRKAAPPAPAE
jgi:hypothetical protein